LSICDDFFDHIAALTTTSSEKEGLLKAGTAVEERIISLHLQGVDFSGQRDYKEKYEKIILDYISGISQEIFQYLLINDLVKIILHLL
jgi:hypothetical protein